MFLPKELIRGLPPRVGLNNTYVPWALTFELPERVVYAKYGEHRDFPSKPGLRRYDTESSQNRRKLCVSAFGNIALSYNRYTEEAVQQVTAGVKTYLLKQFWSNQEKTVNALVKGMGHYMYSDSFSFGRVGSAAEKPKDNKLIWEKALAILTGGDVHQILAIHDAVGRKVLSELGGPELKVYQAWEPKVRPKTVFDPSVRGRVNKKGEIKPTTVAGIVDTSNTGKLSPVNQERKRGVDMFDRDPTAKNTAYYKDLDERNLLFGAGPSGTTGTLLQAAFAFASISDNLELLKQYVMAIVGYLVGGGMHSYHETMVVANAVGVAYDPGAYIKSLPHSFLNSYHFEEWNREYYDIVTLGAIHWMYNFNDGAARQTATHH